ncbi:MAG: hypothetical protein EOO63_00985 [Hymenobacter sp.]|nr:MAG: hypothetical protein EOO63_00985 [Hymenobacter sp.]
MKTTKIFLAAACACFLSTAAFAQTTPASNTTTGSMSGSVNTQPQRGIGIKEDGTVERNADVTKQNHSMTGRTGRKTKMTHHKTTKKTKMSTSPSNTGTM